MQEFDVSLECSSVCVVDANGKIVREAKVASEPQALIAWVGSLGFGLERIGLEAGPLAQRIRGTTLQLYTVTGWWAKARLRCAHHSCAN